MTHDDAQAQDYVWATRMQNSLALACSGLQHVPSACAVSAGAVNRCGFSYTAAAAKCSKCPGGVDSECGSGETCYAGHPDCTASASGGGTSGELSCNIAQAYTVWP
jgi:hypothetical protein